MNCQRRVLSLSVFHVFACLSLTSPSALQAADFANDSGLSRRQILQMGLTPFLEAYQNAKHHSWQVREDAYILYAHYKEQDNQHRLAHLSRHRNRAKTFYTILGKWEGEAISLRYAQLPEGTAVRVLAFRRPAEFEEYMGRMIALYPTSSKRNGVASSQYQQADKVITHLLRHFVEVQREDNLPRGNEFRQSLKAFQAETTALHNLLPFIPPQGATMLIEHLRGFAEHVEIP